MQEVTIELIHPGETAAEDEVTEVFAKVDSTGRDEFAEAGQAGFKASKRFEVWANEYSDQPELVFNEKRLTIYRTYGPKDNDKIELYAAERVGNGRNAG